jgi:POTRA domain-containing FtsQ-type protein
VSVIAFAGRLAAGSLGLGGGGAFALRSLGIGLGGGGVLAVANLGVGGGAVARVAGSLAAAGGFRRRGAPPRRRRRSPLLTLAKPLGIAALTVALPLALGAWLLTSRQFQLHGIDVGREPAPWAAAARVPAPWVRQALAPLLGRNLLRLPLAEVRQRLAANPWIAAAEVAKELPDRLRVTVAERRPAVLLRSARVGGLGAAGAGHDALLYADAAGRPIAAVGSPAEEAAARRRGLLVVGLPRFAAAADAAPAASGTPPPPLPPSLLAPSLLAPPGSDAMPAAASTAVAGALRLAAQLRRLRPGWTAALSQIDVVDEDDYQLRVEGLPCPLLVRGSRLADNLVRFEQLLPELRRRYPALAAVDLRFSRRIVIQPAQGTPPIQPVKAAQPVEPVKSAHPVKAAPPVPPAQAVKPEPPAPAAKTMAPPTPAAPTSSRGSDNL